MVDDFQKIKDLRDTIDLVQIDEEARRTTDELKNILKTETERLESAKVTPVSIKEFITDVNALSNSHIRLFLTYLNEMQKLAKGFEKPNVNDGYDYDPFSLLDKIFHEMHPLIYSHFLIAFTATKIGYNKVVEFWENNKIDNTDLFSDNDELKEENKLLTRERTEYKKVSDEYKDKYDRLSLEKSKQDYELKLAEAKILMKDIQIKDLKETIGIVKSKGIAKFSPVEVDFETRIRDACSRCNINFDEVLTRRLKSDERVRLINYMKMESSSFASNMYHLKKKFEDKRFLEKGIDHDLEDNENSSEKSGVI
jgi:hypothetical protein